MPLSCLFLQRLTVDRSGVVVQHVVGGDSDEAALRPVPSDPRPAPDDGLAREAQVRWSTSGSPTLDPGLMGGALRPTPRGEGGRGLQRVEHQGAAPRAAPTAPPP